MSTRANIIIKDKHSKLYFYRHSDGYPEVTMESLKGFCGMYHNQLRNNVSQSSGWLILLGAVEYGFKGEIQNNDKFSGWKVGAYEPTTGIHGDIEYLYVIDLEKESLSCYQIKWELGYEITEENILKEKPVLVHNFTAKEN